MLKKLTSMAIIILSVWGIYSCSDSSTSTPVVTDKSSTVKAITADTGKTGVRTFFSLRDNKVVDSATAFNTNNWDIAFLSTKIYINGGATRPAGGGGAIVLKATDYETLNEAPATGYGVDSAASFAIPWGSDKGWYHYDGAKMEITPIPGVVLVIRTADGKYAKMKIQSYYKGYPDSIPSDVNLRRDRMYYFKYFYQADGTKNLKSN